ncbi:MAG: DUF1585 domain-containing protein, partial [Myxococcota bacterium]|nr:DUF1585 domain-containing protein [Myxococcota bacterium]
SGSFALQYTREESPIFYTSKAERMAGLVSTHPYNCEDYESTLDENGLAQPEYQDDGVFSAGWVWVNPYWDMENPVRVCAHTAQETIITSSGVDCRTDAGAEHVDCGCGPNLAYCYIKTIRYLSDDRKEKALRATSDGLTSHLGVQVDKLVKNIISADRPYYEILTTSVMPMNGPIVHYNKWWTGRSGGVDSRQLTVDEADLPDLSFEDEDVWVDVPMLPGFSGALTSPAYLIRHATNRNRSNRFMESFLCDRFSAPSSAFSKSEVEPNLQIRDGCKYCHARLEPMSAYWARWPENTTGYLDPNMFPLYSEDCADCLYESDCPTYCGSYKTTADYPSDLDYVGRLHSLVYLTEDQMNHADLGPSGYVNSIMTTPQFTECAVENTFQYFSQRSLDENDQDWLGEVALEMAHSNYSYKSMIRALVQTQAYRESQ